MAACSAAPADWNQIEADTVPTARHEASAFAYQGRLFLIGGRRINPVDIFDPEAQRWTSRGPTPIELHHFQAVTVDNMAYLVGAMTGPWPDETPLPYVMTYDPETHRFNEHHPIPAARRRGGAGAAVYNGKIYIVGGITNGHRDGTQAWFDEYDPVTGEWTVLPDAPHARDHLSAAVHNGKLYALAGRRTAHDRGDDFGPTERAVDIFDFSSGTWTTAQTPMPTGRAGAMVWTSGDEIIVAGGESDRQVPAHDSVEAFNTNSQTWRALPPLSQGRHGAGIALIDGIPHIASGCARRGGEPELTSVEVFR
jgi:hypothetical protein